MKSMHKLISFLIVFTFLQFSGCAVIHFENGEVIADPNDSISYNTLFSDNKNLEIDPGRSIRFDKWYHQGIYQIAEISNPLDINRVCPGLDWNQVTTKTGPIEALFGLLDNVILLPASSAGIDLWSFWSVEYSCRYQ
tara:strand:+ start:101 stop:511 length:411 start_codon:yes stop_codon:yes gene_type:complete